MFVKPYRPVILIILDGFGVSMDPKGNPVAEARKPHLEYLEKNFPFTAVQASSVAVGLPFGEAGNSEVGHLTIGAGRPIYHHLPRIIHAIRDNSFFENPAFLKAVDHVRTHNSRLHLTGLVSSGSVHSYVDHLYALMELLKRKRLTKNVFLHIITDGKDAPPNEDLPFITKLRNKIVSEFPFVTISSVVGRSFIMDRDERWDRIQKSYEMMTQGKGTPFKDPVKYIEDSYAKGVYDEQIEPGVLTDSAGKPVGLVSDNDALIIFDFREDSVREISRAFVQNDFSAFPRTLLQNFLLVTMTEYEQWLKAEVAFPPLDVKEGLSEVISAAGRNQLHIAESEKYAHVTYFFNGGREAPFPHEERLLIPSNRSAKYDQAPEMKAKEIKDAIMDGFAGFDFILANFANADVVGHTGNFEAVKRAVEIIDEMVGFLTERVLTSNAAMIITGDHGNAEQKLNVISGEKSTEHTANPVPFFTVSKEFKIARERTPEEITARKKRTEGIITDTAPTVLELMGLEQPPEMLGKSLLPRILNKI